MDNETNQPIRLHDLMDFNRAFQQYDTLDGTNCLTVGKRHLNQREAAVEAVRKIGLNLLENVNKDIFVGSTKRDVAYSKRIELLKMANNLIDLE